MEIHDDQEISPDDTDLDPVEPEVLDADDDDDDARSNSIDSFGTNNSVMCRYYSISRFEVGSDGNGDRS